MAAQPLSIHTHTRPEHPITILPELQVSNLLGNCHNWNPCYESRMTGKLPSTSTKLSDFQQKFIWWLDWHRFWHLATKRLLFVAHFGPKSLGTWVGWYAIGGRGIACWLYRISAAGKEGTESAQRATRANSAYTASQVLIESEATLGG